MEVWKIGVASPRGILREAKRVEDGGWDGLVVVDSQNLSGDSFVALAMAATVTERIGLGTGVTNSVTRHAATLASAAASVQRISDGRMVVGIGRGDSALAHLGYAPARLAQFETYVRHLQSYLRGESVPFSEIDLDHAAPKMESLDLADAPTESRIAWIADVPKAEVEVAATGPRVIATGAVYADRVMFTLGADVDRVRWGIEMAKMAREKAGLDPDGVAFGAYVNLAAHPDVAVARELVRGGLTTFARFSVMHGDIAGPLTGEQNTVLHALRDTYDMRAHTRGDSRQAGTLTDTFIDGFAIVGPADHCIERLESLAALGLDKIIVSGPGFRRDEEQEALALFETQVLPAVRAIRS
ncbi:MAG: LLM class flavin-dependent oxidoreductase [Gammaproteobacteria bacterium]|nr:LLM class flavin-dependent oxidoreductase [Gammaproteobacteria bacterium]